MYRFGSMQCVFAVVMTLARSIADRGLGLVRRSHCNRH